MGNKTNGLLALLGLGALAWWKYKKSSPEDQQKVKDTINNAKDNLNLLVNKGYAQLLPQPMGFTAFANNILTAIPYNILF